MSLIVTISLGTKWFVAIFLMAPMMKDKKKGNGAALMLQWCHLSQVDQSACSIHMLSLCVQSLRAHSINTQAESYPCMCSHHDGMQSERRSWFQVQRSKPYSRAAFSALTNLASLLSSGSTGLGRPFLLSNSAHCFCCEPHAVAYKFSAMFSGAHSCVACSKSAIFRPIPVKLLTSGW